VHGVVFVALRQHLKEAGDESLVSECFPQPSSYLAIGEYPDEDVLQIASRVASRMGGVAAAEVLRGLGEGVPPALKRIAPTVLPRANGLDELLDQMGGASGGARWVLPRFDVGERDARMITLTHRGTASLCRFDEGMITGFAALLGEGVALRHPSCRNRSDRECVFVMRPVPPDKRSSSRRGSNSLRGTRPLGEKS
jgi:hypothetical protein